MNSHDSDHDDRKRLNKKFLFGLLKVISAWYSIRQRTALVTATASGPFLPLPNCLQQFVSPVCCATPGLKGPSYEYRLLLRIICIMSDPSFLCLIADQSTVPCLRIPSFDGHLPLTAITAQDLLRTDYCILNTANYLPATNAIAFGGILRASTAPDLLPVSYFLHSYHSCFLCSYLLTYQAPPANPPANTPALPAQHKT